MAQNKDGFVNVRRCQRLVELEAEKKSLEAELKRIKEAIEKLYSPIGLEFAKAGIKSLPLESGERLVPRRNLKCNKVGGVPNEVMAKALRREGLGRLVDIGYKLGDLKEYLRSREEELIAEKRPPENVQDLLPKGLRGIFRIYEETKIVVYGVKKKGADTNGKEEK